MAAGYRRLLTSSLKERKKPWISTEVLREIIRDKEVKEVLIL